MMEKMMHVDGRWTRAHSTATRDIIIQARVLSVANSFCAMIRPRAYRPAMNAAQALEKLIQPLLLDEMIAVTYGRQLPSFCYISD